MQAEGDAACGLCAESKSAEAFPLGRQWTASVSAVSGPQVVPYAIVTGRVVTLIPILEEEQFSWAYLIHHPDPITAKL